MEADPKKFMAQCWTIVRKLGKEDTLAARRAQVGWGLIAEEAMVYRDKIIEIVAEKEPSKRILVVKLDNHNPIVCTDKDGAPFRWHGEYARINAHVQGIYISLQED
jgi:hypothetical protein